MIRSVLDTCCMVVSLYLFFSFVNHIDGNWEATLKSAVGLTLFAVNFVLYAKLIFKDKS